MTIPHERYRALVWAEKLLNDLVSPSATPRVPKEVRQRALHVLRHFPSVYEFEQIAESSPLLSAEDPLK